jgi:hypothetical protein
MSAASSKEPPKEPPRTRSPDSMLLCVAAEGRERAGGGREGLGGGVAGQEQATVNADSREGGQVRRQHAAL